jgi:hypothetical protein
MKLLFNGRIRTLDPLQPAVEVVALEGNRVTAVGGPELLERFPAAEREDLEQRVVLPGLTDAHLHLQQYAEGLRKVDCATASLEECLQRVAEQARRTLPGEWILGQGWDQNLWGGRWPTAEQLDKAAPLNPVYLTAHSLHAGWANRAALRRAKIRSFGRRDPPAGRIARDARHQPTGVLFEKAMLLVEAVLPRPNPQDLAVWIEQALPGLWRLGLTGVHDFDRQPCFRALQILHQAGGLKLRVVKSIPVEDLDFASGLGLRSGMGDDMLRIGAVKLFSDGALGPHTAAMLDPYEDDPHNTGLLVQDEEQIFRIGCRAVRAGFSLAVHAIGDRANREVLNAFTRLREHEQAEGLPPLRHRIEHVQVLQDQDLDRLGAQGIVASMQPVHATSDCHLAERCWGSRCSNAYAWRTLVERGTHLAFGSDAPVESPSPFEGLYAAVTRRRPDGMPGSEGWHPEQRLLFSEALAGYTLEPAYACGQETQLGRLAAGYLADLIVLEKDPFLCEPADLLELKPVATMVNGEWVWQSRGVE